MQPAPPSPFHAVQRVDAYERDIDTSIRVRGSKRLRSHTRTPHTHASEQKRRMDGTTALSLGGGRMRAAGPSRDPSAKGVRGLFWRPYIHRLRRRRSVAQAAGSLVDGFACGAPHTFELGLHVAFACVRSAVAPSAAASEGAEGAWHKIKPSPLVPQYAVDIEGVMLNDPHTGSEASRLTGEQIVGFALQEAIIAVNRAERHVDALHRAHDDWE